MTTNQELINLCENIKFLRENGDFTKKKMAEICGIGIGSLNKIERGTFPPRFGVENLFSLSNYFGIEIHKLLKKLN